MKVTLERGKTYRIVPQSFNEIKCFAPLRYADVPYARMTLNGMELEFTYCEAEEFFSHLFTCPIHTICEIEFADEDIVHVTTMNETIPPRDFTYHGKHYVHSDGFYGVKL